MTRQTELTLAHLLLTIIVIYVTWDAPWWLRSILASVLILELLRTRYTA